MDEGTLAEVLAVGGVAVVVFVTAIVLVWKRRRD
jgi:hypothetical protein